MIKKTTTDSGQGSTLVDLEKLSNSGSIKFKYSLLLKIIMAFPAFKKMQSWHDNAPIKDDFKQYLDSILDQMHINVECIGKLNIPTEGGCIFVANHPTGLLENIVWLRTILDKRQDLKMLANSWFDLLSVAKSNIIAVNPFESKDSYKENIKGIIAAKKWLESGGAIMIFPAGEVAHWSWNSLGVEDPPWKKTILSLAKKTHAPIIPCYSSSKNSLLFNLVGNIHPRLRTLMLAREFTAKQKKTIRIATNSQVYNEQLERYATDAQKMAYVRLCTEALNDKPFAEHLCENQEIIDKVDSDLILSDLNKLTPFIDGNEYTVYKFFGADVPNLINEIGRLREYNFRLVGEGSGLSSDIDRHDQHYQQIILWDKAEQRILGGLRVGFGDANTSAISHNSKNNKVYFLEHAKIKPGFNKILQQSLDFGRLFVVDDAPKDVNVILILVRSLVSYFKETKYNYLLGQVSIPSIYPKLSLDIIAMFLMEHFTDENMSGLVSGRRPFKLTRKYKKYIAELITCTKTTTAINKLLHELFQGRIELPSLLRFYLKCNTKLMSFNYDKDFGTVDALMIVNKNDLPRFFK